MKPKFYDNGIRARVLYQNAKEPEFYYMYETNDDNEVTEERKIDKEKGLELIENMESDKTWRKLSNGCADQNFIRDAISALNYKLGENAIVSQLIDEAHPLWERCNDEVIPTPVHID